MKETADSISATTGTFEFPASFTELVFADVHYSCSEDEMLLYSNYKVTVLKVERSLPSVLHEKTIKKPSYSYLPDLRMLTIKKLGRVSLSLSPPAFLL
jgi:hypothetical protein